VKGFKFKLQSVLEARQKKLEESQLEFAKIQHKLHLEKQELKNLFDSLKNNNLALEDLLKAESIDSNAVFIYQNYISALKHRICLQEKKIQGTEKELEEKNRLMLEALKAVKIMEKLKENSEKEFRTKQEHQEMVLVDEIGTNRHGKVI